MVDKVTDKSPHSLRASFLSSEERKCIFIRGISRSRVRRKRYSSPVKPDGQDISLLSAIHEHTMMAATVCLEEGRSLPIAGTMFTSPILISAE